jgi:Probable cobalt transporter subunit (CbtA)
VPLSVERRLIGRGFAAGALAGLLAFAFGRIMAEPLIQRAIDYANGRDAAQTALRRAAGLAVTAPDPELFSRAFQRNVGFGAAMLLSGVAIGGLFAVVYVLVIRLMRPGARPRTIALAIAGAGFTGVFLLPFIKYPANPPGVGQPATIHTRGLLYLAMLGISLSSVVAAVLAGRRLTRRLGGWNAALVALLGLAAWMAVAMAILGHLASETPHPLRNRYGAIVYPGFPADVLYEFRLYAVIGQAIVWSTVGVAFGALAERLVPRAARRAAIDRRLTGEVNVRTAQ